MKLMLARQVIDAARTALNSMRCATADTLETIRAGKSGIVSGEVLVITPLEGDAEGDVILNMNTPTALKIIGKMAIVHGTALTPYGLDSLAELANIIMGNALALLRARGVDLRSLPSFVVAPGQLSKPESRSEACRVPLVTECGVVTMHVVFTVL